MSETRKIAAILVSDVVGYSRLAGADEDRILARLRTLRSDLIDPIISVHHGRIVKRTGDGSIIEFRSVVDAVRCAIEVQTGMVERNVGLPPEKRIEFRIGIHLGDVVEESDGDLMGDGVNIASRLEGCRQARGDLSLRASLLASQGTARDGGHRSRRDPTQEHRRAGPRLFARSRPACAGETGGDCRAAAGERPPLRRRRAPGFRNGLRLPRRLPSCFLRRAPLHGALATRRVSWPLPLTISSPTRPRLSIVVLPFENLSGDKEQDYFADGITDDLTTDLSHMPDSFVIAHGTALTYKGKPVDAKQIGRDLGVRIFVRRQRAPGRRNDHDQRPAHLDRHGAHVWADRFEGERSKLGELQVEAVSRLANSLGVELVKAEALRAARERPNNPDAVDLAMRGSVAYQASFDLATVNKALGYFEHALQLDPGLTSAKIGLADVLINRFMWLGGGDEAVDIPRAEAMVASALSAEPNNAYAHYTKAQLLGAKKQFSDQFAEIDAAIENDHNFAWVYANSWRNAQLGRSSGGKHRAG